MELKVSVKGDKDIAEKVKRFFSIAPKHAQSAGREAMSEVLDSPGIRRYPTSTDANSPPTPYYVRGVGMQYKSYNDGRSERYGSSWSISQRGYSTVADNSASYSGYLTDEKDQASHMARIGWRKFVDVGNEKIDKIKQIFNAWMKKAQRDAGL